MIERRIIIGLIVSTEYIIQIKNILNSSVLESNIAKILFHWCIDYFEIYNKAPKQDIEGIYYQKIKEGLDKDIAEEIEEDILPSLSEEYEHLNFNVDYLVDNTKKYIKEKRLELFNKKIQDALSKGDLIAAETIALDYKAICRFLNS